MADPGLFDLDPAQVRAEVQPDMSAQQKRTAKQLATLQAGAHPIKLGNGNYVFLHEEAAPVHDVRADGRRCRNCVFRSPNERGFFKCWADDGKRATHGAATDVRGWWPGCRDHQYESEAGDAR